VANERHTVIVERAITSLRDDSQIEIDALSGIGSIPGVAHAQVEEVRPGSVTLSYDWTGSETFWHTDEHLAKHGLRKRWSDESSAI
jgi:hypothetical protein